MYFIFFKQCAHFNALYFRNECVEQLAVYQTSLINEHDDDDDLHSDSVFCTGSCWVMLWFAQKRRDAQI